MKLYDGTGPNPRMVRFFLAEKGVTIPREIVDIRAGENRKEPFLAKNPSGQIPALELDDGSILAETTAICEFLEETHPSPPLIGGTAAERAETRMWTRRVDLQICEPMANGFRYGEGVEFFRPRMRVLPEASAGLKACAADRLAWLDAQLAGRDFLCGRRFTMADILLYSAMDFFCKMNQPVDPKLERVHAWLARVGGRPAAAASASFK